MKHWLKENWFKIAISIVLLLIGFSFFYYFVIFLPHSNEEIRERQTQEKSELSFQKERDTLEKCGKVARDSYVVFQVEWNRTHNATGFARFSEMEVHFNKSLNMCVYKGGIADDTRWDIYVFNAYTNEVLKSFSTFDQADKWSEHTRNWFDEFNDAKAYYFEED